MSCARVAIPAPRNEGAFVARLSPQILVFPPEVTPTRASYLRAHRAVESLDHESASQVIEQDAAESTDRRRLLVIASRFPPVASVGATRVRKFVKYLPRFGWDPVVLTGAQRSGRVSAQDVRRATDLDSLLDVPASVPVHRLSAVLDNLPGYASRFLARHFGRLTECVGLGEVWWNSALKWRFQRTHDALTFPDRGIWRLPSAVRAAVALHRRYDCDAIFSSGMPFSDHLVAMIVSALIRRPWLADFRDPWVEYIHWRQWQSGSGQLLTRACEAAVVHRAARVLSVNDAMTERFRRRYQRFNSSKFVTLPNGYDPADFPSERTAQASGVFRMLHAGSLYSARSPQVVLDAFRRFVRETPGSAGRARLEFAGRPGSYVSEFDRPADGGAIRYLGMLSHSQALAEMASVDVNLIILPDVPGGEMDSTAKMYECIGSGRAILAAVPLNGAAAEQLRKYDGVTICAPGDVEGITRAIGELYRLWLAGNLKVTRPAEQLAPLSRQRQAADLATMLTRIARRRSGVLPK